MNTLILITTYLLTLWLADYFFDDLGMTVPGMAVFGFSFLVLLFMLFAMIHDIKGLTGRD